MLKQEIKALSMGKMLSQYNSFSGSGNYFTVSDVKKVKGGWNFYGVNCWDNACAIFVANDGVSELLHTGEVRHEFVIEGINCYENVQIK
jgi:hypothetical protein